MNSAYRGESSRQGWTTEADYIEGQRTDPDSLAADLAQTPGAELLVLREGAGGAPLGTVWLEPKGEGGTWYLGMLTVRPELQDRSLGRELLAAAEARVRQAGGARIEMTVIGIREALIAWYERRGYRRTGETRAFPYDDPALGRPLRRDLDFVVLEKTL